jgi:putative ABC transport system permease protein
MTSGASGSSGARGARGEWGGEKPPHAGGHRGVFPREQLGHRGVFPREQLGHRGVFPRGIQGMGAVATAALGLLVLGCVFAATAGPREALATRTQALRQALAATAPLSRTIAVTTNWTAITEELSGSGHGAGGAGNAGLTASQLGEIASQLHGDFDRGLVHLAPASADWTAITSQQHTVTSNVGGAAKDAQVKLEVTYREPLAQYMRLVAGRYPGTVSSKSTPSSTKVGRVSIFNNGPPSFAPVLQVVVTSQTALDFALHAGSKVKITGPQTFAIGAPGGITLDVTGIVAPRQASSSFWTSYPELSVPDEEIADDENVWVGGAFVSPGELGSLQQDFGAENMAVQWEFPLVTGSPAGQQAQPLYDALNRLGSQSPALTGDLAAARSALTASTALTQTLGTFLGTANEVDTLLWLLYVSLTVAGLITLLLAARMVAMRRSAELAVRRARGASLTQIAAVTASGSALTCVPVAVVAAVLGVLLVPGSAPAGGWWAPAALLLVSVCAPAAIAAWQQRLPRQAAGRRRNRGGIRLVAEATACVAAIAAIIVFRQQGTRAGAGVNVFTSAIPALVAVPAVVVVLRVYPAVLRGLLRGSARRPGAAGFVGLARASRTALTPALPAFALVLALTVATFAGMLRDAVTRGDVAASWQATGADVAVMAAREPLVVQTASATLTPAAIGALAAVPGVTHSAQVLQAGWFTQDGQQVTGLAVDPAAYAALVADTRTFPAVPARLLATAGAGAPQPLLASPQAAALLGAGVTTLTSQADVEPLRVRIAGVVSATPALTSGGAFVIMPLAALRGAGVPPVVPVNEMLLTGTNIDSARLATVMNTVVYAGVATVRSDILNGLTGAPLQHGAFVLFELSIGLAAAFGLAVMLLELALGAAERDMTLARLATMGLAEGQRARVVALEVLPALLGAAVAAVACALVLPWVARPALDLSVFTGSIASVALTPDVASFALPLGGLAVVALAALYAQIRSGRQRGVAATLRSGG